MPPDDGTYGFTDEDEVLTPTEKVLAAAIVATARKAIRDGVFPEMMAGMDKAGFGPTLRHLLNQFRRRQDGLPELAEMPVSVPGWYEDPEYDGYLRWWSGTEWAGGPTLAEHVVAEQM